MCEAGRSLKGRSNQGRTPDCVLGAACFFRRRAFRRRGGRRDLGLCRVEGRARCCRGCGLFGLAYGSIADSVVRVVPVYTVRHSRPRCCRGVDSSRDRMLPRPRAWQACRGKTARAFTEMLLVC